jgi:hypothetical protein
LVSAVIAGPESVSGRFFLVPHVDKYEGIACLEYQL